MQLYIDFCADSPDYLNPVTETIVYRKLLNKASTKLSKASKLIIMIISFYFTSVYCQPTSFIIFL